ncbi:helicase [Spirochaetia bacterium]|nr:helicase [Spirochaetia bacterium]
MSRQQYGSTPWGKWFVDTLEAYDLGGRLVRGKTYANTGKVLTFDIDGDTVYAKVKGSYKPSYKVQIEFPTLLESERDAIINIIKDDPAILSSILQGDLPIEFLESLKRQKIYLIPDQWGAMRKKCNCDDDVGTCKHIAALYYVISRYVDADPYILFTLRGIDIKKLASEFGAAFEFKLQVPYELKTVSSGKTGEQSLPTSFPSAIPTPTPLPSAIPACTNFILDLLPAKPPFCSNHDFSLLLGEFYHASLRHKPWLSAPSTAFNTDTHDALGKLFSRSVWHIESDEFSYCSQIFLVQTTVHGKVIKHSPYDAYLSFLFFEESSGTASYTFLFYLFKFINLIISAGAYFPYPAYSTIAEYNQVKGGKTNNNKLHIIWLYLRCIESINETAKTIAALECNMFALNEKERITFAEGRTVVDLLTSNVLTEYVHHICFAPNYGGAELRTLSDMFFNGTFIDVSAPNKKILPTSIGRWLTVLNMDFCSYRYTLTLIENNNIKEKYIDNSIRGGIEFKLSMDVFVDDNKYALCDAVKKTSRIDLLKAPTALSAYLPALKILCDKKSVILSEEKLVSFLDDAAVLLSSLGIKIIFPKTLKSELKPRLVLQADKKSGDSRDKKGDNVVSYLDLPSLLNFNWQISIGDTVLSEDEFNSLLKQKKGVVKFKNRFLRIDPAELAALFKASHKNNINGANDFLHSYFSGDCILSFDAQRIIEKIFDAQNFEKPSGLNADLREYQMRGYNWMCSLLYAGFGCILADDMGLGKTVQSIAVILHLKESGLLSRKCLIVAPAALLNNWEKELNRFAPTLNVSIYHGVGRKLATYSDVILSTYQTAARDKTKLLEAAFSMILLDEAHLIKNADTRAAKALKEIHATYKLALSGTPVENRLEDMRSIFDFVLPGYLGNQKEFRNDYRIPIELQRNKEKAIQLQRITSPFLLRRLKTDKNIIADLPEKITTNEYCVLEKEQAALYQSVITDSLEKLKLIDENDRLSDGGVRRNAMILTLLTSLKQICDHPRIYDKESPAVSQLSGKAILLLTLLNEIINGGEKVLIFSQYVETLECLSTIIKKEIGEAPLIYHGGLTQEKRSAIVDEFQNNPAAGILLISLKAGGLGLNLTAASRVIHYDLWYNPAVEAQATDRSFRIGQKRNVFVHRFITKNTFEEKIDAIINSKKELAGMSVGTGESWLARMSTEELKELFAR